MKNTNETPKTYSTSRIIYLIWLHAAIFSILGALSYAGCEAMKSKTHEQNIENKQDSIPQREPNIFDFYPNPWQL